MISFKAYLKESIDLPYKFQKMRVGEYNAIIEDPDNPMRDAKIDIFFIRNSKSSSIEVVFHVNGSTTPKINDSKISAARIFATVIEAWKDYHTANHRNQYLIAPGNPALGRIYMKLLSRKVPREWEIKEIKLSTHQSLIVVNT